MMFVVYYVTCIFSNGHQSHQSTRVLSAPDGSTAQCEHVCTAGSAQPDEGQEDHLAGDPGVAGEDEGGGTADPQSQPPAPVSPVHRPDRPRYVSKT